MNSTPITLVPAVPRPGRRHVACDVQVNRAQPAHADAYGLHVWARRQRSRLMGILLRRMVRKLMRKARATIGKGASAHPVPC